MRRKVCFVIIVACLTIAQLYAVKSLDKRELNLTAYKGSYHDFIIRPILGDLNSASGMPFDLTKDDVKYVASSTQEGQTDLHTYGRAIAEWSLHSNHTPLKITINADPLNRVADSSGAEVSYQSDSDRINYILFFPYEYNAVNLDGTSTEAVTGYMKVFSGTQYNSMDDSDWGDTNPISETLSSSVVEGIGLSTGTYPVRFMLAEDVDVAKKNPGTYNATVKITVEGYQ